MNSHDPNKNPWRILRKEPVYDNPWIELTHHDVLTPKGSKGVYGTVHFKHVAIAVLPLDDEQHTWLVGQWRFPLGRYSWEIPEGGCPDGSSPLEAAKRELKEETGLTATSWEMIQQMDLSNSVTDEHSYAFIARGLTQGEAAPEDTEQLAVRRVPFDEAYRMVVVGEITDALSVATILRTKLVLDGNSPS